jgi:hypothetical protein
MKEVSCYHYYFSHAFVFMFFLFSYLSQQTFFAQKVVSFTLINLFDAKIFIDELNFTRLLRYLMCFVLI